MRVPQLSRVSIGMDNRLVLCTALVVFFGASLGALSSEEVKPTSQSPSNAEIVDLTFERDIQPLLKTYCGKCHSGESPKAELDVLSSAGLLKGGESGEPSVVPGESNESPLISVIKSGQMPPANSPRPTVAELESLTRWIDQGAAGVAPKRSVEEETQQLARTVFNTLEWKCYTCHGRRQQQGGLDLRSVTSMTKGGKTGPAIVVGDASRSVLVQRIHADEMPPFRQRYPAAVKPVTAEELQEIERWIDAGAVPPNDREASDSPRVRISPENRSGENGAADNNSKSNGGSQEALQKHRPDTEWWAFRSPQQPQLPNIKSIDRVGNPIDLFLLEKLEARGLTYSPQADRRVLIRRLYDDLWGLPPSPEAVAAFVADESNDAYENLVDRLIAAPQYAERRAQHWLDAAGFAESEGLESADPIFPDLYRYRDYVIRAINEDRPFDQFLTEQLAGDEVAAWRDEPALDQAQIDRIVATGFLRTAMDSTREPAVNFYVNRLQVLDDTVEIVSSNLLGLSMRCARCHSHKYDPISQRDYYQFAAIFSAAYSPQDWLRPAERLIPLLTRAEQAPLDAHNSEVQKEIGTLQRALDELTRGYIKILRDQKIDKLDQAIREPLKAALDKPETERNIEMQRLIQEYGTQVATNPGEIPASFSDFPPLQKALDERLAAARGRLKPIPMAHGLTDIFPDAAPFYLLNRGEWNRRGSRVEPGVPVALTISDQPYEPRTTVAGTSGRRLEFARWLLHRENPLLSRVYVNRVWRDFFGRGIVPTVGEFGKVGAPPSHPELLDHLALGFQETWSMKQLHRTLVLSQAYRQSSIRSSMAQRLDPDNALWSRMPLKRRDAESIRDGLLAISGRLNEERYGPSAATEVLPDGQVISATNPANSRRSVYLIHRRLTPETVLESFDAPRMSPNCLERRNSTVVNQSLLMMHSRFVEGEAAAFANRVRSAEPNQPTLQIERLFQFALCRSPSASESERAIAFLNDTRTEDGVDLLAELALVLVNSAEFLYVD